MTHLLDKQNFSPSDVIFIVYANFGEKIKNTSYSKVWQKELHECVFTPKKPNFL